MASYGGKPSIRLEDLCEDVDDETFLRNSYSGNSLYRNHGNSSTNPAQLSHYDLEAKRQELLLRKKEIEDRTLQSTQRSLSCLRDSEEVGIATAQELIRQREQLERTEKRLDDIGSILRFSQKHIQGIKSVFGGLRNWMGKKNEPLATTSTNFVPSESHLNEIVKEVDTDINKSSNSNHPGLRIRGLYEQKETVGDPCPQIIDKNLDDMLGSVTRLKVLAQGLGEEIESHNDIIENVMNKTEKLDDSIARKNKEIRRLLK